MNQAGTLQRVFGRRGGREGSVGAEGQDEEGSGEGVEVRGGEEMGRGGWFRKICCFSERVM